MPGRARVTRRGVAAGLVVLLAGGCRVISDASPSGLSVTTDLRPTRVSVDEFEQGLDLTVRATNGGEDRIVVRLGQRPAQRGPTAAESRGVSFGLRIVQADGTPVSARFLDASDTIAVLGAGQTLRQQFHLDFGRGKAGALPPGDYRVIGSFGQAEAEPVRLRVRQ